MTTPVSLHKVLSVIGSCTTKEQLFSALNYAWLAHKQWYDHYGYADATSNMFMVEDYFGKCFTNIVRGGMNTPKV
jgi:nucleoside-specific outer membrane channel protein Tsx